jgi:hypothetical protein
MTRFTLLIALLAGCWSASQTTETPKPAELDVRVELAAVTLGDDCGDSAVLPPPVASAKPSDIPVGPGAAAPCMQNMPCGGYHARCDQTSMQLSLKAALGDAPATVKVKKVELLDPMGKVLAELGSRAPTRWTSDGSYVPWNETIAPGQTLAASYTLTSPNWDALTSGRWNAHGTAFQVRVTLAVGSHERTVDKQAITPARLEPPVPT